MKKLVATIEDVYGAKVDVRSTPGTEDEDDGICHLSLINEKEALDACVELDVEQVRALYGVLGAILGE